MLLIEKSFQINTTYTNGGIGHGKRKEQLYEGKAKKVFATDDANLVIVDYKDDATAFNGEKKGTITGKGVINNVMSNHMFQLLEQQGVPTTLLSSSPSARPW